jgi:hypothetical protein
MKNNFFTPAIKSLSLTLSCLLFQFISFAQDKTNESFDATMRNNGKIYVVVAVCLTILIGLFLYAFLIDRKLSKIEKEN